MTGVLLRKLFQTVCLTRDQNKWESFAMQRILVQISIRLLGSGFIVQNLHEVGKKNICPVHANKNILKKGLRGNLNLLIIVWD